MEEFAGTLAAAALAVLLAIIDAVVVESAGLASVPLPLELPLLADFVGMGSVFKNALLN